MHVCTKGVHVQGVGGVKILVNMGCQANADPIDIGNGLQVPIDSILKLSHFFLLVHYHGCNAPTLNRSRLAMKSLT